MTDAAYQQRRLAESLSGDALEAHQLARLNALLARALPDNAFYAQRLDPPPPLASLAAIYDWPYTYKEDLLPPGGAGLRGHVGVNHTWPAERYVRFHQTSGTHGRPLAVLDTPEDWAWWLHAWQYVYDAADVAPGDRLFMAFSFGPFIGFWSAYDAGCQRGCLVVPAGGKSTAQRLELLRTTQASVLCCTPSYALHLAEAAAAERAPLGEMAVRKIIVAGEPGGSTPAVRQCIEVAWNAKVFDHCGATEVGPWGYADRDGQGLHVNEAEFIAEFRSFETGHPASEGELSELVLTSLGRAGCPVIRYRTGDLVRPVWSHGQANRFVLLAGGVLGRVDDMLIIRGVNVFPSAVDQIIRGFPEVVEYRMCVRRVQQLDELDLEIEDRLEQPQRITNELQLRLGLRVSVRCVAPGALPRFEGKGRRLVDLRHAPAGGSAPQ